MEPKCAAQPKVRSELEVAEETARPPALARQMSEGSSAAATGLSERVEAADWQLGRHLLELAAAWGNDPKAKQARAALYEDVRAGNLSAVAHAVRAFNSQAAWEAALWADAAAPTSSYVMVDKDRIPLLSASSVSAALMPGLFLAPSMRFTSTREVLDEAGSHWLYIAHVPEEDVEVTARLQVGQRVELAAGYEAHGDSKDGPLRLGDVTELLHDDGPGDQAPYRIRHNGTVWHYPTAALRRAKESLPDRSVCTPLFFSFVFFRSPP